MRQRKGENRAKRLVIKAFGLPQLENMSLSRTFTCYFLVRKSKSYPSNSVSSWTLSVTVGLKVKGLKALLMSFFFFFPLTKEETVRDWFKRWGFGLTLSPGNIHHYFVTVDTFTVKWKYHSWEFGTRGRTVLCSAPNTAIKEIQKACSLQIFQRQHLPEP